MYSGQSEAYITCANTNSQVGDTVGPTVGFNVVGATVGNLVGAQLSTVQKVELSQLHTSNRLSKMLPARQVWKAMTVWRVVSHEAKVEQPGRGRLDGPSPRQTVSGDTQGSVGRSWWRISSSVISGGLFLDNGGGFIVISLSFVNRLP
jgi:hypothetical protein